MSIQLFRLRGVPDDEAEDIRALLLENEIDCYETPADRWGVSMPAIWLRDELQLKQAKSLIEEYENGRAARMQDEYEQLKSEGRDVTLFGRFKEEPVMFTIYAALIFAVAYISLMPFLSLGDASG